MKSPPFWDFDPPKKPPNFFSEKFSEFFYIFFYFSENFLVIFRFFFKICWKTVLNRKIIPFLSFKKLYQLEILSSRNCTKVSFFHQCSKMPIIPIKKFNIQTFFFQFLWFFRLECWFQGQIIPKIHLILPSAYTQMCFGKNINGNRDVKFLIGIIGHCTDERNLL